MPDFYVVYDCSVGVVIIKVMTKVTTKFSATKTLYFAIGLILIAAATATAWWALKNTKNHDDQTAGQTSTATVAAPNRACHIFTLANAKTLLGSGAKGGSNTATESSEDLNISTCTYSLGSGASDTDRKTASLLVRAPKTSKGAASNSNEFGQLRPATVQDTPGYGDGAYWDSEHGQLNILKNNSWYILSYGTSAPAGRSLDQTRQLADLLINKL